MASASTTKSPADRADVLANLIRLTGRMPRLVVAFSGGVDSTVLAHLLARQRRKFASLRLVHIDHGLQAASAEWAKHCARLARDWRVPFIALRADIKIQRGESPEAAARDARYALLSADLQPGEVLVTAQHRDDQVETLLLQLFRGAGVSGLASMPEVAPFGAGRIARPLLIVTRNEIEAYASRHRLKWIDDPSNEMTRFGRNYLRHRVMPMLREKWVGIDEAIARSARHMAEAGGLLESVARVDLASAADGSGLNVAAMRALPGARRRNALREYIAAAGVDVPSTAKMKEIAGSLLSARPDAQPFVRWQSGVLRRRAGRLELEVNSQLSIKERHEKPLKSWQWKREREFFVNDAGGRLVLDDDDAGSIDLDKLPSVLELRARKGGEKLRPGVRARTQSLKKLLQAAKLTVEERARLPLIFAGDRLVAAGDRWIDASIAANVKSRRRARLRWMKAGKGTDLFSND